MANQESKYMMSWAGGGTPKPEVMNLWVEQTTRELAGFTTLPPSREYFVGETPVQTGNQTVERTSRGVVFVEGTRIADPNRTEHYDPFAEDLIFPAEVKELYAVKAKQRPNA